MRFEVRLFGGFDLRIDERLVTLPTRQCRLLVAYLFAHDPCPHQRALLAGLFWPDRTERRALRSLSDALWRCTRALRACGYSPSPWRKTGSVISLEEGRPRWCDAEEFRRILKRGSDADACLRAVELYRGEFMEGFYHDWCLQERDWFRDRYVEALRCAVALRMDEGNLESALALGHRWCASTPWSEEAHRHLMVLYARLGRPDEAMAQYVRCAEALAQEFSAEPTDETKQLYRSLLRRTAGQPPGATRAPLVGRVVERSMLWTLMERAERGNGAIVLLHGEAGIGKTRLLEELAKMASFRGARIVRAWSQRTERSAWAAIRQLAAGAVSGVGSARAQEALGSEWHEILRPFLEGEPVRSNRCIGSLAVDAIIAASRTRPHLLIWDDLHEADFESVACLVRLARHVRAAPILLAASLRRAEARQTRSLWGMIEHLTAEPTVHLVRLGPLSPEESLELALALEPSLGQRARSCAQASEGNPLLLCELVRNVRASKEVPTAPPERFLDILRSRLRSLRRPAREVLGVLSLLGGPVPLDVIGLCVGQAPDDALMAIEELLSTEMLVEDRQGVRCAHRWVAESVQSLMAPQCRKRLQFRCAQVLAIRGQSPAQVASLLVGAKRGGAAIPFLLAAGRRALKSDAPGSAAEHLTTALRLGPAVTGRYTFRLLEARAAARHRVGDRRGEAADTHRLLVLARSTGEPQLLTKAFMSRAAYAQKTGRAQEGRTLALRARSWARKAGDRRLEARVLCLAAESDLHFGKLREAKAKFGEVLRMGSRGLGAVEIGTALEGAGEACLQRGQFAQARDLFEQGLAMATRHELADLQASCLSALGAVHHALGDDWQALQRFREAAAIWQERQHRRREAVALTSVGVVLGKLGRHLDGLEAVMAAGSLKQQLGDADSHAITVLHEGTLRQAAGELREAIRCFRKARTVFRRSSNRAWLAESEGKLGHALCAGGRLEEAEKHLRASLDLRRALGDKYTLPGVVSQLALCTARLGRNSDALRLSRRAVRSIRRSGAATGFAPLVLLNHYLILKGTSAGTGVEARQALDQAVDAIRIQARRIPDNACRRSFLRHNTEAREILAARREARRL